MAMRLVSAVARDSGGHVFDLAGDKRPMLGTETSCICAYGSAAGGPLPTQGDLHLSKYPKLMIGCEVCRFRKIRCVRPDQTSHTSPGSSEALATCQVCWLYGQTHP